jgi:hypothetical protein
VRVAGRYDVVERNEDAPAVEQWASDLVATTAVLTGRAADVGSCRWAWRYSPASEADVLMLTSTGPSGPLLCGVLRRVTSAFGSADRARRVGSDG